MKNQDFSQSKFVLMPKFPVFGRMEGKMNNNDLLIRLRYALDIKNTDMIEIFKIGGITITQEELHRMLLKPKNFTNIDLDEEEFIANDDMKKCNNYMLESFLNGFIIFKRGKKELKPGESEKEIFMIKDNKAVNNVFLKKLKLRFLCQERTCLIFLKLPE